MKGAILLGILAIIFISGCELTESNETLIDWTKGKTINVVDNSTVSDTVKNLLYEDAAILALREVYKNDSTKFNLIEIPEELINLYYNGLLQIHQTQNIPFRNLIIDRYNIHTSKNPSLNSMILGLQSNLDWAQRWREGFSLTGNEKADNYISQYDLRIANFYTSGNREIFVVETPFYLNILALASHFEPLEGVAYAEPNSYFGGGTEIRASIESEYVKYIFEFGWGDCPSGCIYKHYWIYRVYYNGEVEFIEEYGDRLP